MRLIHYRSRRLARLAVVVAASGAWCAAPLPAQTLLAWPDTAVDVTRYTTVEQCVAAVQRVQQQADQRETLTSWRDTLPWDPRRQLAPAPNAVTDIATRCAERFAQSGVMLDQYQDLLRLYLAAGQDSDATTLVKRRLAGLPSKAVNARKPTGPAVVDSIAQIYMDATPPRLNAADALLRQPVGGIPDRIERLKVYSRMSYMAWTGGDSALARQAAKSVVTTFDSLSPSQRASVASDRQFFHRQFGVGPMLYGAVHTATEILLGEGPRLDSLRVSTKALANLEHSVWNQSLAESGRMFPFPPFPGVGTQALPIHANYWFPELPAAASVPNDRKVSLLVFLDLRSCGKQAVVDAAQVEGGVCAEQFALLRRLTTRFPALEITIIARTHGYYSYGFTASPVEEAEWIRKFVRAQASSGLRIGVISAPFMRLVAPDNRRVDEDDSSTVHYAFGAFGMQRELLSTDPVYMWVTQRELVISDNPLYVLVDQLGLVADAWGLSANREPELDQMIKVLLGRSEAAAHGSR